MPLEAVTPIEDARFSAEVLTFGHFLPLREHLAMSGDISGCFSWREGATGGILQVKARAQNVSSIG